MNITITGGSAVITPTIATGLSESIDGGNLVHTILGRRDPDITLRPASLRTGTLELGFAGATSETASHNARNVLSAAAVFTLNSPERASLAMTFVVPEGGRIERILDPETRSAWIVTVDYQEVTT